MSDRPTPKTDTETSLTHLDCDDSCVEIRIKRGGKEVYGDIVLADFARHLERQCDEALELTQELRGALDNILYHSPQLVGPGVASAKALLAKAKEVLG